MFLLVRETNRIGVPEQLITYLSVSCGSSPVALYWSYFKHFRSHFLKLE